MNESGPSTVDDTTVSVNLIFGTRGESGILTSVKNTLRMLKLLEADGVRFCQNTMKICDVVHAHTFGPIALFLVLVHKAIGKAVVIHAHTTPQDMVNSYSGANFFRICLPGYLHFYYNLADVCIAPSAYTKEILCSTLKVKRRIVVLSNGIDSNSCKCNEEYAATFKREFGLDDRPLVLSIGLVFLRKGIGDFVDAAKKLPNFQFVWVGRILKWPFLPRAAKRILANAPKNVLFTGRVNTICNALSAAQVFMFPSYEENQGIAALEAAACGLPVIVRDLPAYGGFVDGENCLKFTTNEELARAIEGLIKNRRAAERLGTKARKIVRNHDLRLLSRQLLAIYLSVRRNGLCP
jgi:1,2-diacylglycerol-3-alpha-glucose alpha-1,2-glucosyltransferase